MPLFFFDHDCVDRSVTYAYAVRTGTVGGACATWVTAVSTTWVGTCGKAGASTEREVVATCVQFGSRGKFRPHGDIRCV